MMIFKKSIPRRTFLRGVGTTMALPLLDSMVPALIAKGTNPAQPAIRISTVFVPNGRIMDRWIPTVQGSGFEMTPTLEPLTPFRNQLSVLSGLNIKAADAVGNEPGGVHARPAAAFLTGIHPKPGGDVGISMDQVAARELGKQTQLGSLEIGLDSPEKAANDGSYAAYYMNTISWRSGQTPLPMEYNPRAVFERMFGDSDSADPAERRARIKNDRSVIDSVSDGVASLMSTVGADDQAKLSEYLDAIRDIERRILVAEKSTASTEEQDLAELSIDRPAGIPNTYSEHAKLMFDLQVLAYRSDLTRVITFMMGREQTDRPFREIGIGDGHHPLSHHKNLRDAIAQVEKIDLFQSELFSYYLKKMRETPDGDGSLLDHSIILFGSSLSNGNLHLHNDIPVVLAGGGAGKLKGNRHIRYEGLPFSNLLLSVLELANVPVEGYLDPEYSDATGKLDLRTT